MYKHVMHVLLIYMSLLNLQELSSVHEEAPCPASHPQISPQIPPTAFPEFQRKHQGVICQRNVYRREVYIHPVVHISVPLCILSV